MPRNYKKAIELFDHVFSNYGKLECGDVLSAILYEREGLSDKERFELFKAELVDIIAEAEEIIDGYNRNA